MCEIDPNVPRWIYGDLTRLRQVLVNLVSNAIKFTERGDVQVGVRRINPGQNNPMCIEFSVRDLGIGIAPEQMQHLFLPFSQLDSSTTRKYGGTGLGLAISKRLVDSMGGQIWAVSDPGQGTEFAFTMLTQAAAAQVGPGARKTGQSTDLSLNHAALGSGARNLLDTSLGVRLPLRVLLAEDNEINQKLALRMLAGFGYAADVAANGFEVLDACRRLHYDLIFMDVQMPEMDGLEAARKIKADWPPNFQPRIVVMSANALPEDLERAAQVGVDGYITKPINLKALKEALTEWGAAKANR